MFSPYYAWARRHTPGGAADPLNHCAVNVALYGRGGRGWAMTERGRHDLRRRPQTLEIGPSALHWDGRALTVSIDEVTAPWPSRLRGRVTLHPAHCHAHAVMLHPVGQHRWQAIAPGARVEVAFDQPALRWSGSGYLDCNRGDAPLEQAFSRWQWARAQRVGDRSAVFYDIERRGAEALQLALEFGRDGSVFAIDAPSPFALPRSRWGLPRSCRHDAGAPPASVQTLTDAPFYTRSLVQARWLGDDVTAVHESLSLARFAAPWVQAMLPFRMPRRARGSA